LHAIEAIGEMTFDATVESWGMDQEATGVLHPRCQMRPVVIHERD
jgi:hypothetical protein